MLEASALASDGTWALVRCACNALGPEPVDLVAELLGARTFLHSPNAPRLEAIVNNKIANLSPAEVQTAFELRVASAVPRRCASSSGSLT